LSDIENSISSTAFVAIVGKPNVGKSSILNRILNQKVSIVSSKPQTTRNKIIGILNQNNIQLVFLDTPGFHKPKTKLGNFMIKSINSSIKDVDVCLFVTEATKNIDCEDISKLEYFLLDRIKNRNSKAVLAINKIDTLKDKSSLLKQTEIFSNIFSFSSVVPVSAKSGEGLDLLVEELKKFALLGVHFFDDNLITDQPVKVSVSEIIREKLLICLNQEVPHGVNVLVQRMTKREDKNLIDLEAIIYCEKESHKKIIIGKSGNMLKKVGELSRHELEEFFLSKINLQLWVKVKDDWRNNESIIRNFGLD
jgi:GTP-binding protein Era